MKTIQLLFPDIENFKIKYGLQQTEHWGRFTVYKRQHQTIIIDAAHNQAGLIQLIKNLDRVFPGQTKTIIFGMHVNKDLPVLIPLIQQLGDRFYFCEFDQHFSARYQTVMSFFDQTLLRYSLEDKLPEDNIIVLTGSIYFIGHFYRNL